MTRPDPSRPVPGTIRAEPSRPSPPLRVGRVSGRVGCVVGLANRPGRLGTGVREGRQPNPELDPEQDSAGVTGV